MALPRPLAHTAPASRGRSWSLPNAWLPHVLLWPALLALVFVYPLGYSFWLSLNVYNITRPARFTCTKIR